MKRTLYLMLAPMNREPKVMLVRRDQDRWEVPHADVRTGEEDSAVLLRLLADLGIDAEMNGLKGPQRNDKDGVTVVYGCTMLGRERDSPQIGYFGRDEIQMNRYTYQAKDWTEDGIAMNCGSGIAHIGLDQETQLLLMTALDCS